jgi:ribonuclease III
MSWASNLLKFLLFRRRAGTPKETPTARHPFPDGQLHRLQRLIGYTIRDGEVFAQALLHRSFLQRLPQATRSNERLEFLGDSILNLVVADYLYHHFPQAEEGELTKIRSRLVNRKALAAYAKAIHLSDFILMSPSAAQSIGKGYDAITADTFEAIIAAIYLDGGIQPAREFVERQVLAAMKKGAVITEDENYKSMLLEYAQSRGLGAPRYHIVKEEGPDHDRTFTVDVMLNSVRQGRGIGKNKKDAEQAAANEALEKLQRHHL